jgi:raffinose synthase
MARFYCGIGTDPYAVIQDGMEQITRKSSDHSKTRTPSFLGWCTWNAFYTQMEGTNLMHAVQTLLQQAPVRWIILDDGWQHTTNDNAQNGQQWKERLMSLQESPSKFKDLSLKETITQLKTMGLDQVWVWHTLMGYWLGVLDDNGTLYYPHFPSGILDNDKSSSHEASVEKGIGIPALDLFDHYHDYLQSCGVTGVKVDAQGVVGTLRPYKWNQECPSSQAQLNTLVSDLHKALAKSVQSRFGQSKIIHCMAHAPDIFLSISSQQLYDSSPFMRASDDHYPDNPHSHGPHVVACAFNSLLLSHVSIPDWDMFTTNVAHERMARLDAVSRCLSGGPVYISDTPSNVNRTAVDWICCKDGTALMCREAALPIGKCLLRDPLAWSSDPFVIFNTNGCNDYVTSGVLGVFHLAGSGTWDYERLDYGPVGRNVGSPPQRTVRVRPADIPHFAQRINADKPFLVLPFFSPQKAVVLPTVDSEFTLELEPLECDAIAIIPIHRAGSSCEIVVLGIKGKINGAGCILDICVNGDDDATMNMTVQGCGILQYGIRPDAATQVQVDGIPRKVASNGEQTIAGFSIVSIELDASDTSQYVSISIQQS